MSVCSWICAQIGAREHYAIPRAARQTDCLELLLTDVWTPPESFSALIPVRSWRERFHSDLSSSAVASSNLRFLLLEAEFRARKLPGIASALRRNQVFQQFALRHLEKLYRSRPGQPRVLFAYSYAAKSIFQFARSRGWKTVLGQIDPGLKEEQIVSSLDPSGQLFQPFPSTYWESWREELQLSDLILVNSEWSRNALIAEGAPPGRVILVPLVYSPPPEAASFGRLYPDRFSHERPLRLLFLGQVNLRKGMGLLLEVMRRMASFPVEFSIVGPLSIPIPADLQGKPHVRWLGPVPRGDVADFFRQADVFLFPTFSDGFGLTQLEAQAWKLPIIASRNCGKVVLHGQNGLELQELSVDAIITAIHACLQDPNLLRSLSRNSELSSEFSLPALSRWINRQNQCWSI